MHLYCEIVVVTQVIYQSKTQQSMPDHHYQRGIKYAGWEWCVTENHWSNLECTISLVKRTIAVWRKKAIERFGLPDDQK